MTAKLAGMIEAVGRTHFVELTTTSEDGEWRISITKRVGGYRQSSWKGTLAEVVLAAHSDAQRSVG